MGDGLYVPGSIQVSPGANALVSGASAPLKKGRITQVYVSTNVGIPHGREFGVVWVSRAAVFIGVLWQGYVLQTNPTSYPDFDVDDNDVINVWVYGNQNAGAAGELVTVGWRLGGLTGERSYCDVFTEEPGTGAPEIITNHVASVTAGSDPPVTTVGNYERDIVMGWSGTLTTSSTAASRQPVFNGYGANSTTGHQNSAEAFPFYQTASLVITYSFAQDGSGQYPSTVTPASGSFVSMGLISRIFPGGTGGTGHNFAVKTTNLQSGDQWTQVTFVVYSWAVPSPGYTIGS